MDVDQSDKTDPPKDEKPWLKSKTYSLYKVGCGCKKSSCRHLQCPCRQDERMCDDKCKCDNSCYNTGAYRENIDPAYLKERYPHAFSDSIRYHYEDLEPKMRIDVCDELISSVLHDLLSGFEEPEELPQLEVPGLSLSGVEMPHEEKSEQEKERETLEKFELVGEVLLRRAYIHRGKTLRKEAEKCDPKVDESAAMNTTGNTNRHASSSKNRLGSATRTTHNDDEGGDEKMECSGPRNSDNDDEEEGSDGS